jgi:hypothetical protein
VIVRFAAALAALSSLAMSAWAENPKVPPEKDAGGVPVALIGGGLDYTRPDMVKRLARDGEGNIVGWDFVDDDIHPFSRDEEANREAQQLLATPGVEIVPIRVPQGAHDAVAKAAAFLSRTEVRTVVVLPASDKPEDWQLFVKAATHFKDLLFIAPYRNPRGWKPGAQASAAAFPAALSLPNVLSVAQAGDTAAAADVALAASDGAGEPMSPPASASVLAASLATCHAGAIGSGDGAARKAAIIAKLAKPRSISKVPVVEACR